MNTVNEDAEDVNVFEDPGAVAFKKILELEDKSGLPLDVRRVLYRHFTMMFNGQKPMSEVQEGLRNFPGLVQQHCDAWLEYSVAVESSPFSLKSIRFRYERE
jgi:hypothetical protein